MSPSGAGAAGAGAGAAGSAAGAAGSAGAPGIAPGSATGFVCGCSSMVYLHIYVVNTQ